MTDTFKAFVGGTGDLLALLAGLVIVLFTGLLGGTILSRIWNNKIDLAKLISESNGDASMSRLQLLIFTFVISMSFFIIVVGHAPFEFPQKFPAEVLTLLGISGSSYLVSKAIQSSSETKSALSLSAPPATPLAAGASITLTATMVNTPSGAPLPSLTWSLDAPAHGNIVAGASGQATYTAPNPLPAPSGAQVTVRVQASGFDDGTTVITLA